jgi:hypothetical protein
MMSGTKQNMIFVGFGVKFRDCTSTRTAYAPRCYMCILANVGRIAVKVHLAKVAATMGFYMQFDLIMFG